MDRELGASYINLVAINQGTLVFLHIIRANSSAGFPDETPDREAAETGAVSWLASHDAEVSDMPVRFDEIAFSLIGENRALARHRINALGGSAS